MKATTTLLFAFGLAAMVIPASEPGLAVATASATGASMVGANDCVDDHDLDGFCDPDDLHDDNDGISDLGDEVRVFDVAGRAVSTQHVVATSTTTRIQIDGRSAARSTLPSGVYLVQIRAGVDAVTRKIILAR